MSYDFKKEEDVEEFINNLGTEYRFGCYSEKKPEVCHLLGDYLEAVSKDFSKAAVVYKANCDYDKFGKSCLKAGNYYLNGKGGLQKSYLKAIEYFEKGCRENEMESCFRGGVIGFMNIKKNPSISLEKSIELLKIGCDGSNKDACFHLSSIYMNDVSRENEKMCKDMSSAFKYAVKACDFGSIPACVNLSIMYKKGEGVDKNIPLSEKYKKRVLEMKRDLEKIKGIEFQQGIN